jgi:hypothetical protein
MNAYDSYSADLTQIADRRRIGLWINRPDFEVVADDGKTQNVQIITPFTDPFLFEKLSPGTLTVLDIVDGYLVEDTPFLKDYLRYFLRSSKKKSLQRPKKFSRSLKEVCSKVDLIVVASNEQAKIARQYNPNVSVIRDSHDELGSPIEIKIFNKKQGFNLFWEGLGFTLFHFEEAANDLGKFLLETNSTLNLVTNVTFPKYAGKFGKVESKALIQKIFGPAAQNVHIYPWSQEKVREIARECDFGVIPILEKDDFARLKPENKLLIYWRLGLQTLFSDTPSYLRLADEVGVPEYSVSTGKWGEKLEEISKAPTCLNPNMLNVHEYLLRFHSNEVILAQWKKALDSLKIQDPLRKGF